MNQIVEVLKKETKEFKSKYISLTDDWAKKEFKRLSDVKENDIVNERGFVNRSGRKEHTKASFAYWGKIKRVQEKGLTSFVAESKKDAEEHYNSSIQKLSAKISEKGLILSKLKVKTVYLGVNLEIVLTDGTKTVKAFTIIASGEVQKPHYRYLIK